MQFKKLTFEKYKSYERLNSKDTLTKKTLGYENNPGFNPGFFQKNPGFFTKKTQVF